MKQSLVIFAVLFASTSAVSVEHHKHNGKKGNGHPRPEKVQNLEPGTYQNIANTKGHVLNPFTKYRTAFYVQNEAEINPTGNGQDGLVPPPHTHDTHPLEQWEQMRKPLIPENRNSGNDLMNLQMGEYPQPDIRGPMPKNAHPDSTFSSHLHNDWTNV